MARVLGTIPFVTNPFVTTTAPTPRSRPRLLRIGATALVAAALLATTQLAAGCSKGGGTVETKDATSSTTTAAPKSASTIPDLGNVAGPVGSCLSAAAKFTNLVQGVLEGGEGAKRSQSAVAQLKAELPADLHDDADIVAAKFGDIAARGGNLTDADVNDPAYNAASAAIAAYFAKDCKN